MPESAHITSLEALESFRSHLIVFLNAARPALDEVRGEIVRTRLWLEHEQRTYWENQIRRRTQKLQDAEAELFKLRLSTMHNATEVAQAAVRRATAAIREAEAKLKAVKRWSREFDREIEPHARLLDRLRDVLSNEMTTAAGDLSRTMDILADYAGVTVSPPAGKKPGAEEEKP